MPTTSTRRTAAAAARELMNGKIKVVEDLATALDDWRQATAAVDAAAVAAESKAADARTAHDTARSSGWTVAELRDLGLEPPAAPRRSRSANSNGAHTNGGAGSDAERHLGDAATEVTGHTTG